MTATDILKQVGGASASVYAAGFLSMRAWLNLLGVWTGPALVDQTYFAEGAAFFLATAEKILFPWLLVALSLVLAGGLAARVMKVFGARSGWLTGSHRWLPAWCRDVWCETIAVAVGLGLLMLLIRQTLLTPLEGGQALLLTSPRPDLPAPERYVWCVGVALLAAAVWLLLKQRVRLRRGQVAAEWAASTLAVFALFLLPLDFAYTTRSRLAPVVRLELKGAVSPAAFVSLLLVTGKEVVVHDGRIISVLDIASVGAIHVQCHVDVFQPPACAGGVASAGGGPGSDAGGRSTGSRAGTEGKAAPAK